MVRTSPPMSGDIQPCRLKSFLITKPGNEEGIHVDGFSRRNHRPTLAGASERQHPGCDHRKRRTSMSCDLKRSNGGAVEGPASKGSPSTVRLPEKFQKDDFEVQQEALWRSAAERVPPWGKVQRDDYDFCSWMKGASEERLSAGCLYEYARESHKFRCRLVLNKRTREERSGTLTCIKYEGNSAGDVHLIRSGWQTWLGDFADELITNKSFAELLRTSGSKVEKSLDALAGYNLYPKAVELPGRYINVPGMQEVVIQIDWRHYKNKEIGAELARWAGNNRPESEPEPDRTGKKRESKVRADLKALSALRIWKLHEGKPWKRLQEIAAVCGYEGCVRESEEYKQRSKRGHAVEPNVTGITNFFNNSTAGNAFIEAYDTTVTAFFDSSSAGNATIFTAGAISFFGSSKGGTARIGISCCDPFFGGFDISGHNAPGVTIGSIEGGPMDPSPGGNTFVFLGGNNLTVGSNNLSTTFSGGISDGGQGGGVGGSLTKIGTGTLDLSGPNTYTGNTIVNRGVLQVDGSVTSNTFVNHRGTLAGTGTINANVMNNGKVSPGDSPGVLTVVHDYTQAQYATLMIQIAGMDTGQFSVLNVKDRKSHYPLAHWEHHLASS
jgi:autotransporter-associated beta strand protein